MGSALAASAAMYAFPRFCLAGVTSACSFKDTSTGSPQPWQAVKVSYPARRSPSGLGLRYTQGRLSTLCTPFSHLEPHVFPFCTSASSISGTLIHTSLLLTGKLSAWRNSLFSAISHCTSITVPRPTDACLCTWAYAHLYSSRHGW